LVGTGTSELSLNIVIAVVEAFLTGLAQPFLLVHSPNGDQVASKISARRAARSVKASTVTLTLVCECRVFCQTTCIGIAASDMSDNTWINAAIRLSRPSDQETYRTEPKHAYRISNTQTGLRRALGRAQQLSNRVGHPWGMVHSFHYAYPLFSPLVGYYFPSIFNFWNKIFTRSFDPASKTGLRLL